MKKLDLEKCGPYSKIIFENIDLIKTKKRIKEYYRDLYFNDNKNAVYKIKIKEGKMHQFLKDCEKIGIDFDYFRDLDDSIYIEYKDFLIMTEKEKDFLNELEFYLAWLI